MRAWAFSRYSDKKSKGSGGRASLSARSPSRKVGTTAASMYWRTGSEASGPAGGDAWCINLSTAMQCVHAFGAHTCMQVTVCACVRVCVFVCAYVRVCVCICVCARVHKHVFEQAGEGHNAHSSNVVSHKRRDYLLQMENGAGRWCSKVTPTKHQYCPTRHQHKTHTVPQGISTKHILSHKASAQNTYCPKAHTVPQGISTKHILSQNT